MRFASTIVTLPLSCRPHFTLSAFLPNGLCFLLAFSYLFLVIIWDKLSQIYWTDFHQIFTLLYVFGRGLWIWQRIPYIHEHHADEFKIWTTATLIDSFQRVRAALKLFTNSLQEHPHGGGPMQSYILALWSSNFVVISSYIRRLLRTALFISTDEQ